MRTSSPRKLVIYGTGQIASLAHYYFTNDSSYEVAGFTVDAAYVHTREFLGLPVVDFESLPKIFPVGDFEVFVAIGYSKQNRIRRDKYMEMKRLGYSLASYISSSASIMSNEIGENCFILENNVIQPFSKVGDNVTIWSGCHIGHHSTIANHCFLASHIVVSGNVSINESCFVGVNATIRDGLSIGAECVLGAGTLLLHDASDYGVYRADESNRARVPSTRLINF